MDNTSKRLDRQNRLIRAIKHEKNDRVPLLMPGDCALLRYARPDATFKYMLDEPEEMSDIIIGETLKRLDRIDYLGGAIGFSYKYIGARLFGETWLPGREFDDNTMWQPHSTGIMTEDDYDYILKYGWQRFKDMCVFERLGYDPGELAADGALGEKMKLKYTAAGYPFILGIPTPAPFDDLVFARGLMNFFVDLVTMPEKVGETLDVICEEFEKTGLPSIRATVEENRKLGEETMIMVAPCVNANCGLLSRDSFEKFGWPLIERFASLVLDAGAYVFFHMDTNWTDFLDLFSVFPKGRCIFDSDGGTDMLRLKELHSDRFALTGTVSPTLLAFGKPDEVYAECRRQIEMMGDGFILAPSCTLPANTPAENIDAMYAAV